MGRKLRIPGWESGSHSFPNSYPNSPTMYRPGIKSVQEIDKYRHDVKNEAGKQAQSTTQAACSFLLMLFMLSL